ncbi:MAG TPA: contractile injection system protein, VgrG/Pvc8 family, partial [Prosthecobacter sp.]
MSSPTGQNRHAAIETSLGPDKLLLKSMSGREELGRLFDYHLVLLDPDKDVDADKVVGTNATVRLQTEDGATRYFNGYIASLAYLGYEGNAGVYHAHMVPWLWMLSRTSDCRSFQNKSVKQIL